MKNKNLDVSVYRRSASLIAAAAVLELYPEVEPLGGNITSTGFFYDFYFPHPAHVSPVEEKMRQIVKEKREIRTFEMVPISAKEFLKSKGFFERAKTVDEEEQLIEMVEIGPFCDISLGLQLKNTAQLAAFKISVEKLSQKKMRLSGYCHRSKEEFKRFLKKLQSYTEPETIGEKKGFWKGDIWLEEGLKVKEKLIHFLRKNLFSKGMEISFFGGENRFSSHRLLGREKVGEVWQKGAFESFVQMSFFKGDEKDLISLLQLIAKTLTMLGFDVSAFSHEEGGRMDYWIEDGLERERVLVQIRKVKRKGESRIDFYAALRVEEILFMMLEKNPILVELEN